MATNNNKSKIVMPDDRTERAKSSGVNKRAKTYDSLSDIPTLDFDKKVAEAEAKAAEEATPVVAPVKDGSRKVSLADLNPINPTAFVPKKDTESQSPTLGSYLMDQLDFAQERIMKQTQELHEEILDQLEEEAYENGIDPVDRMKSAPNSPVDYSDDDDEDEDFGNKNYHWDDEGESEDDEDEDEEYQESSRHMVDKSPTFKTPVIKKKEVKEPSVDTIEDFKSSTSSLLEELDLDDDDDDELMNDDVDEHSEEAEEDIPDAPDIDQMDDESRQKVIDDLKKEINNHISSSNVKLNLKNFTIKKKPLSISKVMKLTGAEINVADWIAPTAKRAISCSAVSGPEIIKMDPRNSTRNRLNTFKDIYNIIYSHIVDANKPDFETWLKTTYYYDLEHYYFCIYKATFGKSNFMNRECTNPKCKNNFIADVDLNEMVVYNPEDYKDEVEKIFNGDSTTKSTIMDNKLVQISNNFAVTLRIPTIWSVAIETASLNEAFMNKYGDIIDLYTYIDEIYYIDAEDESLTAIDFKPDPNDYTKTIGNKIRACYNVINCLSSDQYYGLMREIRDMEQNNTHISYQVPECECPKCHTKLDAIAATADELLFSRHQLGIIAAT